MIYLGQRFRFIGADACVLTGVSPLLPDSNGVYYWLRFPDGTYKYTSVWHLEQWFEAE